MADLLTSAKLGLNAAIRKNTPQPGCVYVRSPQSRIRLFLAGRFFEGKWRGIGKAIPSP